jgi:hypothetical protein
MHPCPLVYICDLPTRCITLYSSTYQQASDVFKTQDVWEHGRSAPLFQTRGHLDCERVSARRSSCCLKLLIRAERADG